MVVKFALVLTALTLVGVATVIGAYQYFREQEEHKHEKEMLREKRDAALLDADQTTIERELTQEREHDQQQHQE
jgi:Tfp pilus assembly protein PilN